MGVSAWHIWLVLGILLCIAEILTPAFVLASFGFACLFAALAAALDLGILMQLTGFIVGVLVAFFGLRPFFMKYGYGESRNVRTNVDALEGLRGRVIQTIDNRRATGRAMVRGDDWRAVAALDGEVIDAGEEVEVVGVDGVKLIVKRRSMEAREGNQRGE